MCGGEKSCTSRYQYMISPTQCANNKFNLYLGCHSNSSNVSSTVELDVPISILNKFTAVTEVKFHNHFVKVEKTTHRLNAHENT